jgi:hypothetical protein
MGIAINYRPLLSRYLEQKHWEPKIKTRQKQSRFFENSFLGLL